MYNNISLYFSSDCNMQCQYCDINKHKPQMAQNNVRMREQMQSGEYANNVIARFKDFKDKINSISLWGMEPTINADLFKNVAYPLFDYFENIKDIMFSTNSWLGYQRISMFISALDEYCKQHNRAINLDLQISLDGEQWLNDKSRKRGTTKNTLSVIKDIVVNTPHDLSFHISMHTKPTLDCAYMKIFNENHDALIAHYKFFDNLQDEMLKLNTNEHLSLSLAQLPTVVNPGNHTVKDGRIFAEFIHNLRKIDCSQFKHFRHPLIFQPMSGLVNAMDLKNHNDYSHWGCCSSGRYTANVNSDGDLFSCHSLFSYGYLNAEKSVITAAQTTVKDNNPARMQYIDLGWSEYPESRRFFSEITMLGLLHAGQIDECYKDERWRKLLFFSIGGLFCQFGQMETTSSMWAFTTSWFKFMGNGALQEVMVYMKDCGMLEDLKR